VQAGTSFQVFVDAVGADSQTDLTYTGPAETMSSDTGAVLPASLTFLQGEGEFTAILTTVGDQTITVTDSARGITGMFTITSGSEVPSRRSAE
jgi:hypothetical protein